jgi:hypothetical protein
MARDGIGYATGRTIVSIENGGGQLSCQYRTEGLVVSHINIVREQATNGNLQS